MIRRVSVIINTYNRAESLAVTLGSLSQLDHPAFEVIVVNGPSDDGTDDLLERFSGRIKVGHCAHANLSESRNIGVALAAGDIVAFIDDDAYPDPAWLDRLVEGYDSDDVAAVGGPVWDHTGAALQARYTFGTRLGDARVGLEEANPTALLNSPWTEEFVNTLGTNSSFRRDLLIAAGGFDEEFEYYLDENSVCWRLVERGWVVKALDDGYVFHKFLPSDVRGENRATRNRYQVLKSKCFFALKHGLGAHSFYEVCQNLVQFIDAQRGDVRWCVENDLLTEADFDQFEVDVHRAFDNALQAFVGGAPRTRPPEWFRERQKPFLPFPTLRRREDKLHVCFLSQSYPPGPVNGIARLIHTLATGLASEGHLVRVLTAGEGHDRVDLEDRVWVHRVVPRPQGTPEVAGVPAGLWDHAATIRDELRRIHDHRPVDLVEAPNWDSEAIAILADGAIPTVVGLYTPLSTVAAIDSGLAAGAPVEAMLEAERFCYGRAHGFRATKRAIVDRIEADYGIEIPRSQIAFIPHGMADTTAGVRPERVDGAVNVLFVGRLEKRKGIDALLRCIPALLAQFPDVVFTIVGDDTVPGDDGVPFREAFEKEHAGSADLGRVRFTGFADDESRQRLYAGCDISVAPSRSESFGLILVEAMMFGKPVVAGDNPGMRAVVEEGGNGLFASADDPDSLRDALATLLSSPDRRAAFGARSRELFETRFSARRMVEATERAYRAWAVTTRHSPHAGGRNTRPRAT